MGSLSVKNGSEKFSRLGPFKYGSTCRCDIILTIFCLFLVNILNVGTGCELFMFLLLNWLNHKTVSNEQNNTGSRRLPPSGHRSSAASEPSGGGPGQGIQPLLVVATATSPQPGLRLQEEVRQLPQPGGEGGGSRNTTAPSGGNSNITTTRAPAPRGSETTATARREGRKCRVG